MSVYLQVASMFPAHRFVVRSIWTTGGLIALVDVGLVWSIWTDVTTDRLMGDAEHGRVNAVVRDVMSAFKNSVELVYHAPELFSPTSTPLSPRLRPLPSSPMTRSGNSTVTFVTVERSRRTVQRREGPGFSGSSPNTYPYTSALRPYREGVTDGTTSRRASSPHVCAHV